MRVLVLTLFFFTVFNHVITLTSFPNPHDLFLMANQCIKLQCICGFKKIIKTASYMPNYRDENNNTLLHYFIAHFTSQLQKPCESSQLLLYCKFMHEILKSGTDPRFINNDQLTAFEILINFLNSQNIMNVYCKELLYLLLIYGTPLPSYHGILLKKIFSNEIDLRLRINGFEIVPPERRNANRALLLAIGQGHLDRVMDLVKSNNHGFALYEGPITPAELINIIYNQHIAVPDALRSIYYKLQLFFSFSR